MSTIGQPERATQSRVISLFRDELLYRYLGDWTDRDSNSNIEDGLLSAWLTKSGYTQAQISAALHKLRIEADNQSRTLYGNNQAVYNLLRYGVPVKIEAGKVTELVHLIDWGEPERNDFAIAEEVTLKGNHERRPDIVLYVNGIAVGVLELKNSRVSIGDGIRQNLSNQQPEFNAWFFSTVQLVFAGNGSEGLQYGAIGTPEKYFMKWKEDEQDDNRFKLDKYLLRMCRKDRLVELVHDFVLFDGGVKKLPRAHQYFGVKAAQARVRAKKGGIIWHTQGSGKSIVMVLLAKWILEDNPNARVAIITDRDELDKQIERVFGEAGEAIRRTTSGRDLMSQLGQATPRLVCSLVHKFGQRNVDDFDAFIRELATQPSPTVGEVFVFVDECHRTQSGKLHRVMKAMMPNVDKLLTGFDAPPCTYLYIDKSMQDHGLFQAICRVNRLDGEDKDFGYVVDYKDLFKKVENAIAVYTSELDHSAGGSDPEVLLQDRLKKGKEHLDSALESLGFLCEPVEPPRGELEHIHYFCGNTEIPADLQEREPQRVALYKATVSLIRAYANIADELETAGYGSADISRIKRQLAHYLSVRELIRKASGESLDLKAYEADMRHLIDTYIQADEPRKISPFDGMSLLDLIVKTGIADAIATRLSELKNNRNAISEAIENNVRSKIIKEHLNDPAYYERMSALLDEIISARKERAIEYEEYLRQIGDLAKHVETGQTDETPEVLKRSPALRALYNNLKQSENKSVRITEHWDEYIYPTDPVLSLALRIDEAVKEARHDDWRGVQPREQVIKRALHDILQDVAEVERIFPIIKAQKEY